MMRKNRERPLNRVKYENLFFKKCSFIYRSEVSRNTLRIEILGKENKAIGENSKIGTSSETFLDEKRPKTYVVPLNNECR